MPKFFQDLPMCPRCPRSRRWWGGPSTSSAQPAGIPYIKYPGLKVQSCITSSGYPLHKISWRKVIEQYHQQWIPLHKIFQTKGTYTPPVVATPSTKYPGVKLQSSTTSSAYPLHKISWSKVIEQYPQQWIPLHKIFWTKGTYTRPVLATPSAKYPGLKV